MDASGPLAGIRVLELEALGAVPHTAMLLADAGADVLRVERLRDPDAELDVVERGRRGNAVTRTRRSIGLDLKRAECKELVLSLVASADVLLEGFRPGVAERLGVGPDACLAVRPSLVYGRLTGWGRTGPLADRAGHDINYLALSGTLGAMGSADGTPPVPLNVIADFGGGSMQLAFGVAAALTHALRTGVGQVVDAAMIDGSASLATYVHSMRAAGTWIDEPASNVLDGGAPFYGVYRTADDRFVAVGAIEPAFYRQLLDGLGLDAATLPPQLDRTSWPAMHERFADRFASKTRHEWELVFAGTDACVTPVLAMAEAPQHEHVRARSTFVTVGGVVQPAPMPRFGATPATTPRPPVATGTGGHEALLAWGITAPRVDGLIDAGLLQATGSNAPAKASG